MAVVFLAVVAVAALGAATVAPGWDNARLVGLVAFAIIAVDLLSRGSNPP